MDEESRNERADSELVDALLDFIIAAANLAKKIVQRTRDKEEGGKINVKEERTFRNGIRATENSEDIF